MRIVLISLCLATAGCGSKPALRVPVPVKCIEAMPLEPTIEFDLVPQAAPISDQVRALLIDHATMTSSLKEHRALMSPCVISR